MTAWTDPSLHYTTPNVDGLAPADGGSESCPARTAGVMRAVALRALAAGRVGEPPRTVGPEAVAVGADLAGDARPLRVARGVSGTDGAYASRTGAAGAALDRASNRGGSAPGTAHSLVRAAAKQPLHAGATILAKFACAVSRERAVALVVT